jgi:hypothetical protein
MAKATDKVKAEVKEKPRTQTTTIRELLLADKSDEDIIAALVKETGKNEAWGKARLKVYVRAYGERGKDDKQLAAMS